MRNRQRSGRRIRLGSHCARLLLAAAFPGLVALCCLAALSSARAGSDGGDPQAAWVLPQSVPAYLYQLTDIGGLRSRLERQGLSFIFSYYGDAFDNPAGGVKQGPGYDGRFAIIMDGDLEKLAGWSGARVHASIHSIFGTQFSGANLDNLMLVSGVEAPPTIRLFNLWIEQDLTSKVNLRIGQFTAAQDFIVSRNADLFVNSTFGWPMLNTQNLPSGGPNYPEAALGARLQVKLTDQLILRAAIFDGDPAGFSDDSVRQRIGDLVARFGLGLDLVERHLGRKLDKRHAAAVAVDGEDAKIGDHHVDHAGAGERQRAAMQELGVVLGRVLHHHDDFLDAADQVHRAAHALNHLAGDHPVGEVAVLGHLHGSQDGNVDMAAADHGE
jgi:hypothetical protein